MFYIEEIFSERVILFNEYYCSLTNNQTSSNKINHFNKWKLINDSVAYQNFFQEII